jgi:4'-phosphopantetheinyl transferase
MPLIFKQQRGNNSIALWKIDEKEESLLQMLPPLKEAEQIFLNKISHAPRRIEWLASRILLYSITGIYPKIFYNDNGQPTLLHSHANVSISHTRGYAAIAVSSNCMPGIDIEYPSPRIRKVSSRFLNSQEEIFISETDSQTQLALIWCAKEAIYKKAGQAGLNFKDQIIIAPFSPNETGTLEASLKSESEESKLQLNYYNTNHYSMVWIF